MKQPGATSEHPSPLQQAGVEHRDIRIGQVRLRELTGRSLARLRLLENPATADPPLAELPARTGGCGGSDPAYLCLGPREWLVVSSELQPTELLQALQSAMGSGLAAAYDLTQGLAVLRLTGAASPWLLAKLSCLDFVGGAHDGEHCARTRVGDVAVTIHYHRTAAEGWAFDVIADRSIAAHLWALLRACAPHANELNEASGAVE
jgi:heterotetrameric sarcosine oxidase gamma subunit